jgi:hypothetical protein
MVPFIYYFHILACFFGLAYLPFSKIFHIFATPVSLLISAATETGKVGQVNAATMQRIELDGCSHGGVCHFDCPVRQRRMERIEASEPFEPELDYVGQKDWKALGNRPFEA